MQIFMLAKCDRAVSPFNETQKLCDFDWSMRIRNRIFQYLMPSWSGLPAFMFDQNYTQITY